LNAIIEITILFDISGISQTVAFRSFRINASIWKIRFPKWAIPADRLGGIRYEPIIGTQQMADETRIVQAKGVITRFDIEDRGHNSGFKGRSDLIPASATEMGAIWHLRMFTRVRDLSWLPFRFYFMERSKAPAGNAAR